MFSGSCSAGGFVTVRAVALLLVGCFLVTVVLDPTSEPSAGGLFSDSFLAADSSIFSGSGARVRRLAGRRAREFLEVVFGAAGFALPGSADAVGVESLVGAAATSGAGGSSIRAPTDETRLPFFPIRTMGFDGGLTIAWLPASNGSVVRGSNDPPK